MRICFFIFLLMVSCNKHEAMENLSANLNPQNLEEDFFPEYYSNDTLSLNVMIDDCGEWGGPEDKFRIYIDSLMRYRLDFKRYRFNCDSIGKYYGEEKPIEFEKALILNKDDKKIISGFLVHLMKAKIHEKLESDSGDGYKLFDNDSSLFISIRSTDKRIKEDYYKFKKDLGFPENRKEDNTEQDVIIYN